MKFIQVLGFATMALSIPSPVPVDSTLSVQVLDKRETVGDTIESIVGILKTAVEAAAGRLTDAVADSPAEVIEIQTEITDRLKASVAEVQTATTDIVTATAGTANIVLTLTGEQVRQILNAIMELASLLQSLRGLVTVTLAGLGAATNSAITSEIAAVRDAINSLIAPVIAFAIAVLTAPIAVGTIATGLANAVVSLITATLGF